MRCERCAALLAGFVGRAADLLRRGLHLPDEAGHVLGEAVDARADPTSGVAALFCVSMCAGEITRLRAATSACTATTEDDVDQFVDAASGQRE